jgi:hypothetical protein
MCRTIRLRDCSCRFCAHTGLTLCFRDFCAVFVILLGSIVIWTIRYSIRKIVCNGTCYRATSMHRTTRHLAMYCQSYCTAASRHERDQQYPSMHVLGGKSACPSAFRALHLGLGALTRSPFRQAHKVASVGNGWVSVVVQERRSVVDGVPPPRNAILARASRFRCQTFDDFILTSSPRLFSQRSHRLLHLQSSSSAQLVPSTGSHDEPSKKSWFCSECLLRAYSWTAQSTLSWLAPSRLVLSSSARYHPVRTMEPRRRVIASNGASRYHEGVVASECTAFGS